MKVNAKKKIRKSTRRVYAILGALILVISIFVIIANLSHKIEISIKEKIYSYSSNLNYDYKVNLKPNEYINDKTLGMDYPAYVTDLIDNISLNLDYNYNSDKQTNIAYEYDILGKMQVVYTRDGEEQKIIENDEVIKDNKTGSSETNKIDIKENLLLDLKQENSMLKKFEQEMGMSISAKYKVILNVRIKTNVENENVDFEDKKIIEIDLGAKTTKIESPDNKSLSNSISKDEKTTIDNNNKVAIVIAAIFALVGIRMLIYVIQTRDANYIRNESKEEVNYILKTCNEKIVEIDNMPQEADISVVNVKEFDELIKLSEELFKPILYWENKEKEEYYFMVISNQIRYEYVIKRG